MTRGDSKRIIRMVTKSNIVKQGDRFVIYTVYGLRSTVYGQKSKVKGLRSED